MILFAFLLVLYALQYACKTTYSKCILYSERRINIFSDSSILVNNLWNERKSYKIKSKKSHYAQCTGLLLNIFQACIHSSVYSVQVCVRVLSVTELYIADTVCK